MRTFAIRLILAIFALALLQAVVSRANAATLSLVPEVGYVKMSSAPDDFWYEQAETHSTEFNTAEFGAALRLDVSRLQLSAGWRNLGNQHQWSNIINDAPYFACKAHPASCPPATQYWTEAGNEQQTYLQLAYAFRLPHGWSIAPEVGIARTKVTSHVNFFYISGQQIHENCPGPTQHLNKPIYGVTAQRGNFGVGVDLLNTEPDRSGNDCTSPIQGSSAVLLRVTYAVPL